MAFTRVTKCTLGKGGNLTLCNQLDSCLELKLIPGNHKKHCGPPVKIGLWFGLRFDLQYTSRFQNTPCCYFSIARMYN